MSYKDGILAKAVAGLWAKRSNNPITGAFTIAPPTYTDRAGRYEYRVLKTDLRKSDNDVYANGPRSPYAELPDLETLYDVKSGKIENWQAGREFLPKTVLDELEFESGGFSPVQVAAERLENIILSQHLDRLYSRADAALSTPTAGTLDLSSDTFALSKFFRETRRELMLIGGSSSVPNFFYCGPETVDRMAENITMHPGFAGVTNLSSPSQDLVRIGYSNEDVVRGFLRTLGLELIVEDFSKLAGATNVPVWHLTNRAYIGQAGAGGQGFASTFVPGGQLKQLIQYQDSEVTVAHGRQNGIALGAWANFEVEVTDPSKAFKIDVTLA